ncbi:hypothetical protein MASR1M32_10900 [Rhodobacter sp.]
MRPADGVGDHALDIGVVIGRVGLVPRPEVEQAAGAAFVGDARAEHLAALEPRHEDGLHRVGDAERLAIHLFVFQFEVVGQAGGDGMAARGQPEPLPLTGLAPGQVAGCSHQPFEGLREMGGVKKDRTHAGPDGTGHLLDNLVAHVAMGGMAPPDQDIGVVQPARRQAVIGLVQRRCGGRDAPGGVQRIGDALVHAGGVDAADGGGLLLVDVLAPDGDADAGHGPIPFAVTKGG